MTSFFSHFVARVTDPSLLYTMLTLCFKVAQRDTVKFKKLGLRMLSTVIDTFKHTYEKLGDDDDEDDPESAPVKQGPLILEQYEALIHSCIRSCMKDRLQSFLYSSELYTLIQQFLTLGIS